MALLVAKEHVEEPTNWSSPIFVVPKPNEDMMIIIIIIITTIIFI